MDREELERWLLSRGLAEPKSGYGHASATELASALLTDFDIHPKMRGGTVRGTEKF